MWYEQGVWYNIKTVNIIDITVQGVHVESPNRKEEKNEAANGSSTKVMPNEPEAEKCEHSTSEEYVHILYAISTLAQSIESKHFWRSPPSLDPPNNISTQTKCISTIQ